MSDRITDLRLQIEQIQALRGQILRSPEDYNKYKISVGKAAPALLEALPLLLDIADLYLEPLRMQDYCYCCERDMDEEHDPDCPVAALEAWAAGGVESGEGGKA